MKKMNQKYNLLTAIIICFLVYVVLSWLVPTGTISNGAYTDAGTNPVGLFGIVYYPGIAVGTFIQFGLMILALGCFYGVMNKTGVYGQLIDKYASKFKGKEKLFLIITIILMVVLSSISGLPYALLIIVPLLMAIILKLGYSKVTAVAATVGSILLGSIGSTFGYTIAGMEVNIAETLELSMKITDGIWSKLALLVIVLFLFILFVTGNKHAKINKKEELPEPKKRGRKKETAPALIEEEKIIFLENEVKTNKSPFALKLILGLTFLLALVSMFNWNVIFDITVFEDFYEKIIGITVSDYPLLQNILGLTNPFGYWDSYEIVAVLLTASVLLGWIYSLSLTEVYEGMRSGAKRVLKAAFFATIANIVFTLMLASSNGTMLVFITDKLASISESFNLFAVTISGIVGGFFYNNFYYFLNAISSTFMIHYDAEYYTIMTFILQGIYGLMMLIVPTSVVLVSGLSLLNVSYKEWIKYIWQFVLQLLVIILIISVILVLVV